MVDRPAVFKAGPFILVVFYSLAVHFGVLAGHPVPAALFLFGLILAALWRSLRQGVKAAWIALVVILALAGLLWHAAVLSQLFLLPPVAINIMMLLVFGQTLLPGNTPMITRFSLIMKGDIDEKAWRYTRRVTEVWTLFFGVMALQTIMLALFASPFLWSIFTNLINYLLIVLFFLLEYAIRIRLFPEVDHPGFIGFIRSLVSIDFQRLRS